MAALDAMVDRTIGGRGGVVNVVRTAGHRQEPGGPGGRGAGGRVAGSRCFGPSASRMPVTSPSCGGAAAARGHRRGGPRRRSGPRTGAGQVPDADPQDLLLLDDLLGIADPDTPPPQIDPDARRRRLTALINAASLARTQPALYIIEDAHWIDAVSESMLAELPHRHPANPVDGADHLPPRVPGSVDAGARRADDSACATGDSDTAALLGELLGSDPSVAELAAIIAERAAREPVFRRGDGARVRRARCAGRRPRRLRLRADVAEVSVPATVQAAIAARIDRLDTRGQATLNAASVIGSRFAPELLAALGIDPVLDELLGAELIDQVRFTPTPSTPSATR